MLSVLICGNGPNKRAVVGIDLAAHPKYVSRSGLGLLDELHCVADGQNGIGGIVRNFNAEFFFESHDQFDGVERVRAKIVDEACAFNYLVGIDAEMINNNFLNAFSDIAHVGFLDLCLIECLDDIRILLKPATAAKSSRDPGKPVAPFSGSHRIAITQYDGLIIRVTISQSWPA